MATFTVAGRQVTLTPEDVKGALRGVTPEPIQKHAVEVDGTLFPVVQALEVASGIAGGDTRSSTARRVLSGIGMRLIDVGPGTSSPQPPRTNNESNIARRDR